ncbi:hypothetical protein [Mycolicibacterium mageritense]|uniref:hypothetical protein n=1 Tax=Mycolicibacterium mageritense TaxID=53462 RepID=UPI001E582485|nr:hypothetical protein [Mycolicibacterium mageritense]MCC9185324.1 hypothetical protein [Mycolicibacterium mageritense]
MNILQRNYDLVASASTGATLSALSATIGLPWPIWAVYGVVVAGQLGNRMIRGWAR